MDLEPLPDLKTLSDTELKRLIGELKDREVALSAQRRALHGRMDMLRYELVRRLSSKEEGELSVVDLDGLANILAGRIPDIDRLEG
ncbi:MAG: hypothetical protein H6531_03410 [Actinobacteria bacterium]|nr:hypothetical protein [Thermoleophilia bacterium]MCB9010864.1 hypothetical protein [Actinomycetota bacterium]